MSRYIDFLKKIPLFDGMSEEVLEEVAELLTVERISKNKVVFQQGDPGDAMYIILAGGVKIVLYSEDGREVILALLKPGDFFGDMALITEQLRSASVIASEDSSLLRLSRKSLVNQIHKNPNLGMNLLKVMALRLSEADEKIGDLALVDVYGRVARYLLKLAKERGRECEEGILVEDRPTHQQIANTVGTARETVSRAVSDFIRRGRLRIEGSTMILLDAGKLAGESRSA